MTVPAHMTALNISGRYTMNKSLSDSPEQILTLQGVGWLTRKAISVGTITLNIADAPIHGVGKIVVTQLMTGGIPGSTETRILDWEKREVNDPLFGPIIVQTKRIKFSDLDVDVDEHLKTGWTPEITDGEIIQSFATSDTPKSGKTWQNEQTWGFVVLEGETERRYARRLRFVGPKGEVVLIRLVYDYVGVMVNPRAR